MLLLIEIYSIRIDLKEVAFIFNTIIVKINSLILISNNIFGSMNKVIKHSSVR